MTASPADPGPVVGLADVRAAYGRRQVLDGLTLSIAAGEAYALLGPNGAGKSTAARILSGLMRPSAGTVRYAGGRPRVGLAPQDCALFGALTIRENLLTMARAGGLERGRRAAAVDEALALAQCAERAGDLVRSLSGGWRRRANLAAALVCRPRLLVLDEPTEGVDAATRQALAQAVRSMLAQGAAGFLVSHDAAFVQGVADRVGILAQGRLVAEGAPADLIREAFGRGERVTVRFAMEPGPPLRDALTGHGFAAARDAVTWTRIDEGVETLPPALLDAAKAAGGEVSARRPDLDDLVARMTGRLA